MSEGEELQQHALPDPRTYGRIVWDLAWPAIALNSLQVVNSLLDAKFVSSLSPETLNASGAAQPVMFLLVSLAFALGTGATALVSRFYGAQDIESVRKASRQALSLSAVAGFIVAAVGAVAIPAMAHMMVKPGSEAYPEMLRYLYPVMVGLPAIYVLNTLAASLRAVGDTRTPMYVSGFQILLHIALNTLLIFPTREIHPFGFAIRIPGADLGIAGAGWAFAISSWVSAFLYFPASGRTALGKVWQFQMPVREWMVRVLRISLPASLMTVIRVTSFIAFTMALKYTREGENALGAMRVGIAMEAIAFMPAFGYMIAASALVGQSLGMKKPERAEKLAWAATNQAVITMTVLSIAFLLFAPQIASFFVTSDVQLAIATGYLRIIAVTEPLFGYAMVLTGALQGAGDTTRPTWAAFASMWLFRVPLVWVFAVTMNLGVDAAWWAMALSQAINGVIMIWLFKQGRWKTKTV